MKYPNKWLCVQGAVLGSALAACAGDAANIEREAESALNSGIAVDRCFVFDVYAKNDITCTQSDFEGSVGAGGSIQLEHFSVNARGSAAFGVVSGGAFSLQHGSVNGSIEASGNIFMRNYSVWNAEAAGTCNVSDGWHLGAYSWVTPRFGATRLASVQSSLEAISDRLAAARSTPASVDNTGRLLLVAPANTQNVAVFNIDVAAFATATIVEVDAPSEAVVILNVVGADSSVVYKDFVLTRDPAKAVSATGAYTQYNGISPSRILFNFTSTAQLDLTGSVIFGTVLAPRADMQFRAGRVEGGLYVKSLLGVAPCGQVNLDPFVAIGDVCHSQVIQ